MRPTEGHAILADALHRHRYPDHPVGCSCQWARSDELEALEVYDRLRENGAHVAYDLVLPESAPRGEPKTAAASIDDLSDRQWAVWFVIQHFGPIADHELIERYEAGVFGAKGNVLPPQSAASIRSRRAELVRAGHIEKAGDERRKTPNGGTGAVWRATGQARAVAA